MVKIFYISYLQSVNLFEDFADEESKCEAAVMGPSVLIFLVLSFLSAAAHSGNCELTVQRLACPGKEENAVEPYKGKANMSFTPIDGDKLASTTISRRAKDLSACKRLADKEKRIARRQTLKEKVVTAKFDGQDAGTYKATSNCD